MQGIVMDIKKNKAVVFQKNGAVIEISNHNYQIGQKITVNSHSYRKYMLVAACFVLCFVTSISGYALYNTPSSYIYVDINPSLRLDINCFEQVIDVVPLNDDASELMKSYSFKSRDTENCINDIVKACEEKKYLNQDNNDVELDIVTDRAALKHRIDTVSKVLKEKNLGVSVLNIDKDENSKAISANTSPRKLRAIENYTNVFGGTLKENTAKLRSTAVKDIYSQIEGKQDTPANSPIAPKEKVFSVGRNMVLPGKRPAITPNPKAETEKNTDRNIDKKPSESKAPQNQEVNEDKVQSNPSQKRSEAIEEYSKVYGGSVEDNAANLKEKSVKEIQSEIEKQNKEEQADEKITPSEKSDKNKPLPQKNKNALQSENTDKKPKNDKTSSDTPNKNKKSD